MTKKSEKKSSAGKKNATKRSPARKASAGKKAVERTAKKSVSTTSAKARQETAAGKASTGKATTKKKASFVKKAKSVSSSSAKKKTAKKSVSKAAGAPKKPKKEAAPGKSSATKKAGGKKQRAEKATKSTADTGGKKNSPAAAEAATSKAPPKGRPVAFSLEEAREVARTRSQRPAELPKKTATARKSPEPKDEPKPEARVLGAASLSDILGRNPKTTKSPIDVQKKEVPKKFIRYFNLLIDLRNHVVSELDLHTKDTLKRSSKEDSGNLSGYSQHIADAGTDSFDRDFALSLVSTEQEALSEIEAAIERIHKGTYGVCEITGKPISRERLLAVPFARYSVEGQAEYEKTLKRPAQRGGAYMDSSDNDAEFFTENSDE